jgi:hypothetical protein
MIAASKAMPTAEPKSLTVSSKIEELSRFVEFIIVHVTKAGFRPSRPREVARLGDPPIRAMIEEGCYNGEGQPEYIALGWASGALNGKCSINVVSVE